MERGSPGDVLVFSLDEEERNAVLIPSIQENS